MIYNACRGYGPALRQSLPKLSKTCSFQKQRPDQVCPQSAQAMIQVQISQALGEEGRARRKTPPPTQPLWEGAQRLAALPRGSVSVYEVPLPNLWEQTQLPSRSANKCLQLRALGMAEMALNPTDSLSLPLYFIYIFLNEYLGDHWCWLNTVINRVLLFFTENHYKSNPCFRGREQHSTPNHTKRPRIPIYLWTSALNLCSSGTFFTRDSETSTCPFCGCPGMWGVWAQQTAGSLGEMLEGISH